jgi:hypothetical protein
MIRWQNSRQDRLWALTTVRIKIYERCPYEVDTACGVLGLQRVSCRRMYTQDAGNRFDIGHIIIMEHIWKWGTHGG